MRVLVDGKEARELVPGEQSLAQVYRELVGRLFLEGRTVVAVVLDGQAVTDEELTKLLDGERAPCETMELRTLDTVELSRETLTEVLKHLERLRDGLQLTIDHLGRGERAMALAALRPTLEVWLAICEAVQKVCVLVHVDLTTKMDDRSVGELQQSVIDTLGDVQGAIEQEDWAAFAEVLAHKLLPSVEPWEALVISLRDRLETDQKT